MTQTIGYNLGETGATVYFIGRNDDREALSGSSFVTYDPDDVADYAIALPETGSSGDYGPIAIPSGVTWWEIYVQSGGSEDLAADDRVATGFKDSTTVPISGGVFSVDNVDIVESRIIKLGTRADQVTTGYPTKYMRTGEVWPYLIDTSALFGGRPVATTSNAESSDAAKIKIALTDDDEPMVGVLLHYAVVWLEALGVTGDEVEITLNALPNGGVASTPISFTMAIKN